MIYLIINKYFRNKVFKLKSIVIYFSKSGNIKKIASETAELIKADIKEIISLENMNGIFGFLKCGFQAITKKEARIGIVFDDLDSYDLVVICGPVWVGHMSSPIRAFLKEFSSKINNPAFIILHIFKKNNYLNVIKEMSDLSKSKEIASLSLPIKKDANYKQEILSFAKQIASNLP